MNLKYFSPSENAFYAGELKESYIAADSWPSDALEVDESLYLEFIDKSPEGKYRGVDNAGMPCWLEIPPPTAEEMASNAENMRQQLIDEANVYINKRQWPGKAAIGRLKGEELVQYNLWLDYLDALELVDTSGAPDIEWPTPPAVQAR
ncbi:TPA: tail fiber assembly protein [Escherichia coli]|nr:tail fiber assembly protein [Escherichia coli]HBE5928993.1 tail fiber assembly protein [Escherichia coli]HBE5979483.1 tail fiber assembly protein [Escherichia coli]